MLRFSLSFICLPRQKKIYINCFTYLLFWSPHHHLLLYLAKKNFFHISKQNDKIYIARYYNNLPTKLNIPKLTSTLYDPKY